MSKIRLHGSSSGYTEIAPASAAGSGTVTLPTSTGEILLTDGSAASLTQIPAANLVGVCTSGLTRTGGFGGGKILQVQSTLKTDTASYTLSGGALSTINISVSITPASASNKIIIHAHLSVGMDSDGEDDFAMCLTKDGGNYDTLSGDASGSSSRVLAVGSNHDHTYHQSTISATAVDTAGGTSAITYGIAVRLRDNGSTVGYVNRHSSSDTNAWDFRPTSGITVMEVEV